MSLIDQIDWNSKYLPEKALLLLTLLYFLNFTCYIPVELVKFITPPLHLCTVLSIKHLHSSVLQLVFRHSSDE